MKKFVTVISLVLVAVMLCTMLVSCSKKLNGTYTAEASAFGTGTKTTLEFSGSNVKLTITVMVLGQEESESYEGAYEIVEEKDGKMTINFSMDDEGEESTIDGGTLEIGDDYIKIAGLRFEKQK